MAIISLIAAIDEQYGLGLNNQLLCHLPADLMHFKTITMGKPIIMGRSTYESIGKPLPGRTNIVLSKKEQSINGVEVANSFSKALSLAAEAPEVMIIGGGTIFKQALPYALRIYLTIIHHQFPADVFFPRLDETIWRCQESVFRHHDEKNKYDLNFNCYERI